LILTIDTSTPACTAALIGNDGTVHARRDEIIGRGHAERLVPLIAEMIEGHVPTRIIVGTGPGSFTGLRIGIAAAHGLAIGWEVPLAGMSSLALIAAGAPGDGPVAVAVAGGHGELFVQQFNRAKLSPQGDVASLKPMVAAQAITAPLVVGSGAATLVEARGSGEALDLLPAAANALLLPKALRSLPVTPAYARPPDAAPRVAA